MENHKPKSIYQLTKIITEAFSTQLNQKAYFMMLQSVKPVGIKTLLQYSFDEMAKPFDQIHYRCDELNPRAHLIEHLLAQLDPYIKGYAHMSEPAMMLLEMAQQDDLSSSSVIERLDQLFKDVIEAGTRIVWVIHDLQWCNDVVLAFILDMAKCLEAPITVFLTHQGIYKRQQDIPIDVIEVGEICFDQLLEVQISDEGRAKVHLLRLKQLREANHKEEAYEEGRKALKAVGFRLPKRPNVYHNLWTINRLKGRLSPRRLHKLLKGYKRQTSKTLLQKEILTELIALEMTNDDRLFYLLMQLSLLTSRTGQDGYSALGLLGYVLMNVQFLGEENNASSYEEKIFELLEQNTLPLVEVLTLYLNGTHLLHRYESLTKVQLVLDQGLRKAEILDERTILLSCTLRLVESYILQGMPVSELRNHVASMGSLASKYKAEQLLLVTELTLKGLDVLTEGHPDNLEDHDFYTTDVAQLSDIEQMGVAQFRVKVAQTHKHFIKAQEGLSHLRQLKKNLRTYMLVGQIERLEGLQVTFEADQSETVNHKAKAYRLSAFEKLYEKRVNHNPDLYGTSYKMMNGLHHVTTGQLELGMSQFEQGILLAKDNQLLQDQAILNDLLVMVSRQHRLDKASRYYALAAYEVYCQLGFQSISDRYNKEYGFDLTPEEVEVRWFDESLTYDLHKVIKDYERIERNETGLQMKGLFEVLKEKFQPDKCRIILEHQLIYHIDHSEEPMVVGFDIEDVHDQSKKVIRHVIKTLESVCVNNNEDHLLANYDAYMMDGRDLCILCVPILYRGLSIGVVYLESSVAFVNEDVWYLEQVLERVGHCWVEGTYEPKDIDVVPLDEHKLAVLTGIKEGLSYKDLGEQCHLNHTQLEVHIKELYECYEVENIGHLNKRA